MTSDQAIHRLQAIVDKFQADYRNVEHLTIQVHRSLGGQDFIVEEEWDWKG